MTDLPEWALRRGRVVRIAGAIDTADDPSIITLSCSGFPTRTTRELVDAIVDEVTQIVVNLYPRWLDDDEPSGTANVLDVAAAEVRARRLCRATDNFAPFVVALARSSAGGEPYRRTEPVEARWAGLMRLLRRAYRRDAVVVYLTPDAPVGTRATVAQWLAHHGGVAVWLDDAPGLDRFSILRVDATVTPEVTALQHNTVTISRCEGMPAPHSDAEQHLERALARSAWAGERRWNRGVTGIDALAPKIIADLQWSAARLVVEIDGPDHRAAAKYSADRIRDNILQSAGFIVLRYTNEQVLDDVDVVVAGVRAVVAAMTEGSVRGARSTGGR